MLTSRLRNHTAGIHNSYEAVPWLTQTAAPKAVLLRRPLVLSEPPAASPHFRAREDSRQVLKIVSANFHTFPGNPRRNTFLEHRSL